MDFNSGKTESFDLAAQCFHTQILVMSVDDAVIRFIAAAAAVVVSFTIAVTKAASPGSIVWAGWPDVGHLAKAWDSRHSHRLGYLPTSCLAVSSAKF